MYYNKLAGSNIRKKEESGMLTHLHVKNLAIIEDAEIDFYDHLNILTGETGAGKSIIIGSVNIALGARVSSDIIRNGAEYAYVELIFEPEDYIWNKLLEYDIFPDEGRLVISRKIMNKKSISKINGETVTLAILREVSSLLIDIHGQNEHQSLLYADKHLEILDRYKRDDIYPVKSRVAEFYAQYCDIKKEYDSMSVSEEERVRRISFMEFEKNEIETAGIRDDEEAELEYEYRKLANAEKIAEAVSGAYEITGMGNINISSLISKALMILSEAGQYDDNVSQYADALSDADNIIADLNHDMSTYMDEFGFDEHRFKEVSDRLDFVRKILAKYGGNTENMSKYYDKLKKDLKVMTDYEEHKKELDRKLADTREKLDKECNILTNIRLHAAQGLKEDITRALSDLNFGEVIFDIVFEKKDSYSSCGMDNIEFMISTNPGEEIKPLAKVASGGELSRIMLGVKSVLSRTDRIHTLVFDEIDTGISGRTAQKVSEKLAYISREHQVICITHLAQIASMADRHFVIEKGIRNERTSTQIRALNDDESNNELARILGGAEITEAVLNSAREMKELAVKRKENIL